MTTVTTVLILLAVLVFVMLLDRVMDQVAAAEAQRNLAELLALLGDKTDDDKEISDNLDI